MANPARKNRKEKGHGTLEVPPDIIEATLKMDFDKVKACIDFSSDTVHQLDQNNNNVMHLCIGGGTMRMRPFMDFFIRFTDVNLLHRNGQGYIPLDMAIAINDIEAMEMLYKPTVRQLNKAYPDSTPDLKPI